MARQKATDQDRHRAKRLGNCLSARQDELDISIQDLSTRSSVRYETVRMLLTGRRVSPSFFLVADLAKALGLKLDELARKTR